MRLHIAILRGAAWLVPAPHRAEWFAEWGSELWYVKRNATGFCLGAYRDAYWVRRHSATQRARLASPVHCILWLVALAATSVFFAFRLPLPRALLLPSPYGDARDLVSISSPRRSGVRIEEFRSLEQRIPYRFRSLAFYRPVQAAHMPVALASGNLFELLQIPVAAGPGTRMVLTRSAWRKYFHADPRIVGRVLEVAGQTATVAAVIPGSLWDLPGRVDAWLLEDQSAFARLPSGATGYVLGRLATPAPATPRWDFEQFECSSLAKGNVLLPCLLMAVVSLLLLSATTTLSLGEYPANRTMSPRRWIFFGLKLVLLAPIVCCGSLDVASIVAAGFEAHGLIVGTILAMRWALMDQRRRCPVCLRVLTNPTRIGGPSHIFLDWYGTELICAQGHGLLYVPEILTSCYGAQRWQYLDASWSTLFS